jgi:SAM-dependent methyltransferase
VTASVDAGQSGADLRCPACAAPLPAQPAIAGGDRLHGIPGEFTVHVCGACGSGRTTPYVPPGELGALYPTGYNAYALPDALPLRAAATGLFRWRYWRGLRRPPLEALRTIAPTRLLDVGSGRGDLGVVLRAHGWQVTGLEPSGEAAAEATRRGVPTVVGTLTTARDALGDGFSAVVFQHSLEHVAEPLDDLRVARELMRAGGVVMISVPNFGSWQARRFGADWFHLDLPRHRSHFTAAGLESLLQRAGLVPDSTYTSTSADGLPMSLQYRRFGGRRWTRGAGLYAATAATLAAAPLTALIDRASGRPDLLHAVARRRSPKTGAQ